MRLAGEIAPLLCYPGPDWEAVREEALRAAGRERGPAAAAVRGFCEAVAGVPRDELERRYVETFDFDPRASLYLTYHLYGDQRRRGEALVALKRRYAEAGLELTPGELPDFLPAMLEFAALAPRGAGARLLGELREPLELVRARLAERERSHALLLEAVARRLPRLTSRQQARVRELAEAGPPTELVGLDPPAGAAAVPMMPGAPR